MKRRNFIALVGSATIWPFAVHAQDYPTRPIKFLVPYAPGGVADIAARLVGQKLAETLGQPVVVENRPGGSGFVALMATVGAAPDGYTFVVGTVGEFAINPALYKNIPYDVERDLIPVAMLSDTPLLLVANSASQFRSVKDVIVAAKAKPGEIPIASAGTGTFNHLAVEWFSHEADIKLLHVPYRGGGPAAIGVAAGDVPLGILAISPALPFLQSGRIRVLAVTTAKRSSYQSEWKTLQEEGVPEVDASNWVGMFAPKGVPQPIVDRLHDEIQKILMIESVKASFALGGSDTTPMSITDFNERVRKDTARLKKIVAQAAIKAE